MKNSMLIGKKLLSVTAALLLLLFMANMSMAKATAKATSSDAQLKQDIAAIDGSAVGAGHKRIVADRIAKEFKVSAEDVASLRNKLPGLGDVAAVYAFADKMPGGVTPDNLDKVVSERQSKKDWDEIATTHDIKLSSVSGKVKSIYKDVHKDIKKASAGKASGTGAGGGKHKGGY